MREEQNGGLLEAICTASAPTPTECRDNYLTAFLWPCKPTVRDLLNSVPILILSSWIFRDR